MLRHWKGPRVVPVCVSFPVPEAHTKPNSDSFPWQKTQHIRSNNIALATKEMDIMIACHKILSFGLHINVTSLPLFPPWLSSSDTGNKTIGATVETSNDFSSLHPLPVPLEVLTPRLPIVDLKLYGVAKFSLDSNLCLLSIRLCFSIVILTSCYALALDLVFISNHTCYRRHHYVHIFLDLDN